MRNKFLLLAILCQFTFAFNKADQVASIFNLKASNIDKRLQHLRHNFTSHGWSLYSNSLRLSGIYDAIEHDSLDLSAKAISGIEADKIDIEITYNADKYEYKQIMRVNVSFAENKIDSFTAKVLQQGAIINKKQQCKLLDIAPKQ